MFVILRHQIIAKSSCYPEEKVKIKDFQNNTRITVLQESYDF